MKHWRSDVSALPVCCCLLFLLLLLAANADLSPDFYSDSCPDVEIIVQDAVIRASRSDTAIPGRLLRLVFHDCFVEGCDASVLLQGNDTERTDPANLSLGGFHVIDNAKRNLEQKCPNTVSCADIIVLAAKIAVEVTGGPSFPVALGRRDGLVSTASSVRSNLIDTSFSIDAMAKVFASKGLSIEDVIVLSGGHTIGIGHCNTFSDRFKQNSTTGKLVLADNFLDKDYANQLIKQCPANASQATAVSCDPVTPFQFDNQYYINLVNGKGLFQSDSVLVHDNRTKDMVQALAQDPEGFFNVWADSFVRLTAVGVKTDDDGEIRNSCSSVNG